MHKIHLISDYSPNDWPSIIYFWVCDPTSVANTQRHVLQFPVSSFPPPTFSLHSPFSIVSSLHLQSPGSFLQYLISSISSILKQPSLASSFQYSTSSIQPPTQVFSFQQFPAFSFQKFPAFSFQQFPAFSFQQFPVYSLRSPAFSLQSPVLSLQSPFSNQILNYVAPGWFFYFISCNQPHVFFINLKYSLFFPLSFPPPHAS